MQTMPDAEVGHILTNLYSSTTPAPPPNYDTQTLTPASSAPTPIQNQNLPPISLPANQSGGNSSSGNNGQKRSRSRPTKSCEECRRKKLKCDRELPCSNCKKGGRDGSICFFKDALAPNDSDERWGKRVRMNEERPIDRAKYPNVPSFIRSEGMAGPGRGIMAYGMNDVHLNDAGPGRGVLAYGMRDVAPAPANATTPSLARAWSNGHGNVVPAPMSMWGGRSGQDENARALGRVHVKGTRSRYVGIGDRMAMLDHFEDSKGFILRSFKDPEMSGMIHELAEYQNAFQPKHKPRHVIPHDQDELMVEMMKAIPSGFLFGILQARYISNWETIWRVLHIGTFMKECDQIAQIRDSGSFTLPPHIRDSVVPQILAMLSAAVRLSDPNDRSSTTEQISDEQTSKNCQMVNAWLDGLHGKALVNLHTLQTRTLLLLARQANLATPSELWVESGILVRNAMIMGLHQDPEPWDAIPKFDKELRRKLWMTIVELDLQFSLGAGMPSALSSNAFNMRELVKVDDHDLAEDMTEYPASKPLTVWTHALPQIALGASLRDRLHIINTLGGNLNLERDAPMLLQQAAVLEKALISLPTQFRASTRAGNSSNKRLYRLFTSIMIDISIRRPLMTLYRVISMSSLSSRYPEARKGALRCALAILSHLDALDPSVADLNIVKTRDYLNLFHILRKSDILQSALILCYEIKSYNSRSSTSDDEPHEQEDEFPHTQYLLTRVVENTLNSLIGRLGEFGSDLKDILPVAVAVQSVRSDGTLEEKKGLMRRGAERVLEACRRVRPDVSARHRAELEQNGGENNMRERKDGQSLHTSLWRQTQDEAPQNSAVGYDAYNIIPDENLGFENLDFGFFDWEMSQSWL